MIQLGLIGYPLGHSLSPKIHTAALGACNLQGDYSLFPIHPEDKQGLKDLLSRVRSGELHGLNVTIPHKQNVIEFMDELTPTSQAIGAVNIIYMKNEALIGDNTDAPGFLSDLNRFLSETQSKLVNRKSAIVLGAGGSARAVVYALLTDGWNVALAARRLEQARQLADSFTNYQPALSVVEGLPITDLTNLSTFDLIVNTTPLGMSPNIDRSPLPKNVMLPPGGIVYDLVYNPRETKLVRDAKAQGLPATTGLGMLIEQAALSFELWTGHSPSGDVLYNSVVE
jgi:shikimate dehydrogenase